jgi:hypothetical protein
MGFLVRLIRKNNYSVKCEISGPSCDEYDDPCDPSSCFYGDCQQIGNSQTEEKFECLCDPGFHGLFCEKQTDHCEISPCHSGLISFVCCNICMFVFHFKMLNVSVEAQTSHVETVQMDIMEMD